MFGTATTMTFLIDPIDGGSRVTMEADVQGRGLGNLITPMVTSEMRKSTVAALRDLRRLLAG